MEEFKPLIKNSKFVYVWLSQILSQLTISIMNFLLLIRLFAVTGSAIATSLLWVAYALPAILIGPFAAASVDLFDKRKMLMITNLLQSATIFGYALIHETKFFLLYGVAFTYSLLNQFYVPAESASIPSVVPKKHLPFANGLFFVTQQGALIVGFGIAGVLNHWLGYSNSIFLAAGLLFLAFVSVSFLPELKAEQEEIPKTFQQAVEHFFETIVEGYQFIKEQRSILAPFVLLICLQIASTVVTVNIPVVATELLGISPNSAGTLIIVPAGIGAIIAAIFVPKLLRAGARKKKIMETCFMGLGFLFIILAFLVPEIPGSLRLIFSAAVTILIGLSFVGILIPAQTYLQEATPGGLRGRVFGNFWFLVTIATLLPVMFSGAITELLGIRTLLVIMAGLALAALIFSKRYGQKMIENGFSIRKSI